jgi:adenylate cyclase
LKIPFRRGILSSILLLLLLATTSIWAAGDWSARVTGTSLAEALMDRVGDGVAERVARQLEPAMALAKTVADLIGQDVVGLDRPDALLDLLETKAEIFGVDRLYVGAEDGRFLMVVRQVDGRHRRRVVDPAGAKQYWSWLDEGGERRLETEPVSYDPRRRTWYTRARDAGPSWTEIYRFESDGQPGITAAVPVVSASGNGCCVVGVDVTLAELSTFLERLQVSPGGRAFLLDEQGNLVAHPDPAIMGSENGTLLSAADAADPMVVAAISAGDDGGAGRLRIADGPGGAAWRVLIAPVSLSESLPPFSVGVAVPEADFLSGLQRSRVISAVIALLSIGLGIFLAVTFSRGIARPIVALEQAMTRVEAFDLDVKTDIDTVYVELQRMVQAFDRMVTGLHSFSSYVPTELVRDLVATGRKAELGGEERELSMYFSDIAGFTTLAEEMEPQALVSQLAEYFEVAAAAIRAQQGTIDKFIGDAVMALWNAPRHDPDHPLHCALAAVDVVTGIEALNDRWQAEGKPPFHTRIGLGTADVVVGNVGSSHRLSYTALGDGVNLAARLEGANKHYGTRIIAAEALVSRLPEGAVEVQPLDVLVVKGKAKGVRIFEVLGRAGAVDSARLEDARLYAEAFARYLDRDFAAAEKGFREVMARRPDYKPAQILAERCTALAQSPPGEDWDGSFVLNEK